MNEIKVVSKIDHSERSDVTEKSPPTKKRKFRTAPQISERTITTRSLTMKANKARFDQFINGTQIHPLLIDHVVDLIIELVVWPTSADLFPTPEEKSKNLSNIRLVCKQWSEQGARLYRKNREPEVQFGVNHRWHSVDLKMEKFLNDMHYSRVIPVQRYFFDATFFTRENYSMFKQFMLTFGPTIVEIELYFDHRSNMSFDRDSFANLDLSGLKQLLIDLGGLLGYPYLLRRTHDTFVEVLLKASVNLERFWFRIPERETTADAELLGFQAAGFQRLREVILGNLPNTMKCLYLDLPVIQ